MAKTNAVLQAFNRGEVSPLALARLEVDRIQLSAEEMINWMPKTLGPMGIRPGLKYIGATASNNACRLLPFIASTDDVAILELTASLMRVWVSDALITAPSVATTISNGSFATSANWTDASVYGATLTFGANGLEMNPVSRGAVAQCTRTIAVAGGDQNVRHSMKIVIPSGYGGVVFRLGTSSGDDDLVEETRLLSGEHHLSFTPTGANIYLDFRHTSRQGSTVRITSVAIEASGVMTVATPWAAGDLSNIQFAQSADVVFVACTGVKQYRIERRNTYSWSVVEYISPYGPFIGQTFEDVQLKPGAGFADLTVLADRPFFKSGHEGAIFRVFHDQQVISQLIAGDNQYTDAIRVAGVVGTNYNDRAFEFAIQGTWVGTLTTQRSLEGPDTEFYDFPRDSSAGTTIDITANATYSNEDVDDNLIAWYRMGFKDGDFTSGHATITITYNGGGDYGIIQIFDVSTSQQASAHVIRSPRGPNVYTRLWSEGAWSGVQGYPSAVALYEGRLWWFGGAYAYGSVSDDFENFDQETVGDSGPIVRSIGEGPVDQINFALPLSRLIIGTSGDEFVLKSSSIDEPLTPTNFSVKPVSSYGSKTYLHAVKIDDRGIFVDRSGGRLLELAPANTPSGYDVTDLTLLHPSILKEGVVGIAVQNQPDVRAHCVLSDGTVAILTYNHVEDVLCWSRFETDGDVERAIVLPGTEEDAVYYIVKRTINGSTVRYLEKWALESEIEGSTLCRTLDSFLVYSGASTTTITGLSHLEGETVYVWADGNVVEESDGAGGYQPKDHTVTSGQITLTTAATNVVVGLQYTATYKSSKLAYAAQSGTALGQRKLISQIGVILYNTHHRALKFGQDFTTMDVIPQHVEGTDVASGTIHSSFDHDMVSFPGSFYTDSRLCLKAVAPYPVTVLAAVIGVVANEKG